MIRSVAVHASQTLTMDQLLALAAPHTDAFYRLLEHSFKPELFDALDYPQLLHRHTGTFLDGSISQVDGVCLSASVQVVIHQLQHHDVPTVIQPLVDVLLEYLPYESTQQLNLEKHQGALLQFEQHTPTSTLLALLGLHPETLIQHDRALQAFTALVSQWHQSALSRDLEHHCLKDFSVLVQQYPDAPWLWWASITPWRCALLHLMHRMHLRQDALPHLAPPFYFLTDAPFLMGADHYLPSVLSLLSPRALRTAFDCFDFSRNQQPTHLHALTTPLLQSWIALTISLFPMTPQPSSVAHYASKQMSRILEEHLKTCPLTLLLYTCIEQTSTLKRYEQVYRLHFDEHDLDTYLDLHFDLDALKPSQQDRSVQTPEASNKRTVPIRATFLLSFLPLFTPHSQCSFSQLIQHQQRVELWLKNTHQPFTSEIPITPILAFDPRFLDHQALAAHLQKLSVWNLVHHPFVQQQMSPSIHQNHLQAPWIQNALIPHFTYANAYQWSVFLCFVPNTNALCQYGLHFWQRLVYPISEQGSEGAFLDFDTDQLHTLVLFGAHLDTPFSGLYQKKPTSLIDLYKNMLDTYRFDEAQRMIEPIYSFYQSCQLQRHVSEQLFLQPEAFQSNLKRL